MQISKRTTRWLIAVPAAVAFYALVGFLIVPWIAKSQAQKILSETLGRQVSIGGLSLNPFSFRVEIRNFVIREADGKGNFVAWKSLVANFDPSRSLTGEWVLGELKLDGFQAELLRDKEGKLNFADILARLDKKPAATTPENHTPAKPGRPVRIGHLEVNEAKVAFADAANKSHFSTVFAPLSFRIDNLVTLGESSAGHFEAVTAEGEHYTWNGTLSLDPLASKGSVSVDNFRLGKHYPYAERWLRLEAPSGLISLKFDYEAQLAKDGPQLKLKGGEFSLQNLKLTEKGAGAAFLELAKLGVKGLEAEYPKPAARIQTVELDGMQLAVRREADGSINLLKLLENTESSPAVAGPAAPAALPSLHLASFQLSHASIVVRDLSTPRPAELGLGNLKLSLKDLSLAKGQHMPLDLSFDWNAGGKVSVQGDVVVLPELAASLQSRMESFDLSPLSPYVEQFTGLHLVGARLSENSSASLSQEGEQLKASAKGDIQMEQVRIATARDAQALAGLDQLKVAGFEAAYGSEIALAIDKLTLTHPFAKLTLLPGNKIDLLEALHLPATPATAKTQEKTQAAAPKVRLNTLEIADAELRLTDASIKPAASFSVSRFGGSVTGISLSNTADLQLKLSGLVGKAGKLSLEGHVQPFAESRLADVRLELEEIDLLAFSPYAGKFAGYTIADGHLSFSTKSLLQGSKLQLSNLVNIQDFNFGEATHSPDAVKLPVRLGVSLLKDANGKIELDIPVEGSLEDPQFRIGKAVWHVIGNIFTKAASSPFSLLGSMFGGGGEELSFQQFAAGSQELTLKAREKLDTLGKALNNRPALKLEITPHFSAVEDGRALRLAKLETLIQESIARHRSEKAKANTPALSPEQERHLALSELFAKQLPKASEQAAATTENSGTKPGLLKKAVRFLRFWDRKPAAAKTSSPSPAPNKPVTGPSDAEMEAKLCDAQTLPEQALVELAQARAKIVRDRLAGYDRVAEERLSILPASEKNTRVELTLK